MEKVEIVSINSSDGSEVPKEVLDAYNDDMVQVTIIDKYKDSTQTTIDFDQHLLDEALDKCENLMQETTLMDMSSEYDPTGFGYMGYGMDDPNLIPYEESIGNIGRAYDMVKNVHFQVVL